MAEPTLVVAALAGLASFLSPCMLPVIPAFLAQLAGTSLGVSDLRRRDVLSGTVLFVVGFSVVFAMCAHVPSLMIEYRPKCLDFMKSVGQERFTVRTDQLSGDLLEDRFDELLASPASTSRQIAERMLALRGRQEARAAELLQRLTVASDV